MASGNGHHPAFNPFATAELVFEGTRYDGSTVTVRVDFEPDEQDGLFADLPEMPDMPDASAAESTWREVARERRKVERLQFERFGERVLVGWNLTDKDDVPIEAGGAGMNRIPVQLARLIRTEWEKAVWNPSAPLLPRTPAGGGAS